MSVTANLACANHRDVPAVFECTSCRSCFCSSCALHRWTPKGFVDDCPQCQVPLMTLSTTATNADAERGPQGFLRRIPDFLVFPVTKSPLLISVGLALITTPILWAVQNNISPILAMIGALIVAALELATYFHVVGQTANGKIEVDAPDVTDLWEDLANPLVRYLAAGLPMIAAILWFGHMHGDILLGVFAMTIDPTVIFETPGPAILFVVGLVLLPLLTVVAAISRSVVAVLNPVVWIQSLRILGPTYVLAAAAFYLVLAFEALFWHPLLLDLRYENPIPLLTPVLTTALGYLAMLMRARILGGLCEPYFREQDD